MRRTRHNTHPRSTIASHAPGVALAALALVVVVAPASVVALDAARASVETPAVVRSTDFGVVGRSFGVAGLIGVIATLLASPVALAARGVRSSIALAAIVAPMTLPPYLAYAAWNLLRAPNTPLGDLLLRAAADGAHWAPGVVGRGLAVLGLAVWTWPLAAMPMLVALRRVDSTALDAARLEPAPRRALLAVLRPALLGSAPASIGLVGVVMLGSAIPLHVAQFDTLALRSWILLDLLAPSERWRAWIAAWPALLCAAVAAVLLTRAATRPSSARAPASVEPPASAPSRWTIAAASLIWIVSIGAPLALFASALERWGSIPRVLSLDRDAWWSSLGVASIAGGAAVLIALASWQALVAGGRATRRVAIVSIGLLTLAGLAPGVLIGSAIARLGTLAPIDLAGVAPSLAHLARFGFVAALAGCWLAATEPAHARDIRAIDGVSTPRRWLGAVGPWALAPLAPVALVVALLAFHEIETAVLLTPPGRGNLARKLLDQLHFQRTEELSAACIVLGIASLALATPILAWALRKRS